MQADYPFPVLSNTGLQCGKLCKLPFQLRIKLPVKLIVPFIDRHDSRIREYLNPLVIAAYGIFGLSWAMTTYALRYVEYAKNSPVIEATSYIWGPLFGVLLLREKITKRRFLGMMVILAGICIFTFS